MVDFNIVTIIAIILGIIGLVWLIHSLWKNYKINSIRSWPKVIANVIDVYAIPANHAAGNIYVDPRNIIPSINNNAKYTPVVIYRYKVGNKEYKSQNVVYSGSKSYNAADTKTILGQLHPGSLVQIYYNPRDHNESYVFNGTASWIGTLIGVLLLLLAGYLFYTQMNKNDTDIYNNNVILRKNSTALNNRSSQLRNRKVLDSKFNKSTLTETLNEKQSMMPPYVTLPMNSKLTSQNDEIVDYIRAITNKSKIPFRST